MHPNCYQWGHTVACPPSSLWLPLVTELCPGDTPVGGCYPGLGVEPKAAGPAAAASPDQSWRQGRGLGFPLHACDTPVMTRSSSPGCAPPVGSPPVAQEPAFWPVKTWGVCPSSYEQVRGWQAGRTGLVASDLLPTQQAAGGGPQPQIKGCPKQPV
ncbi:unnamed protein product [Rangifer tarandus platyrhynchus]|uniref:Uncharacterized protein n=2 Tax=Rangifer tarandus platyrhynchus TaxID=3082113 RepID=A0ACB1KDT7_RANTA|nr:unnamed protein product [Rangifer tarandus platyrhynchus]